MADLDGAQHGRTGIEDVNTGNDLVVNSDGSINVVNVSVSTPTTADQVIQENFGNISTTTGTDTIYTITNTKTLVIQIFSAGSEAATGGSVTELFEDPNGDLSVLNRIGTIFSNGDNANESIQQEFSGDGTRRIVLRQRGYIASAREMFGRWQGYEE
jgi:hypothetical protein